MTFVVVVVVTGSVFKKRSSWATTSTEKLHINRETDRILEMGDGRRVTSTVTT